MKRCKVVLVLALAGTTTACMYGIGTGEILLILLVLGVQVVAVGALILAVVATYRWMERRARDRVSPDEDGQ